MKFGLAARASVVAIAAATTLPADALAQSLADQIVVTATKRAENIQDVPIAISAYSGDLLDKSGVSDIRELSILSPSIIVVATQSEAVGVNARIRGVGTVGDNPGLQSSVGVFIDDVYRSRNSVALGDLGEIEAIEVARGPQGTTFGRNSSAGALIVRTKQPEYEFGGYAEYTRQNFNGNRAEGAVTGPIIEDVLAGRINGFFENRDGFLTDSLTDREFNDRDQFGLRGQLLFEPNDVMSFRLIGDYSERDEICCASVRIVRGPTTPIADALSGGAISATPADPFERVTDVTQGRDFGQDVEDWGLSLNAVWDVDFAEITSVTSYREFDVVRSQDSDLTGPDIFARADDGFVNGFETFTQELRAAGDYGPLSWLFGVYYSDEDVSLTDRQSYGTQYEAYTDLLIGAALIGTPLEGAFSFSGLSGLAPGTVFAGAGQDDSHLTESRSIAVFSNNTFDVTDRLSIILGGRYTNEQIDYSGSLNSTNPACLATLGGVAAGQGTPLVDAVGQTAAVLGCLLNITPLVDGEISDEREENEFTWDAKLTYQLTDNISFYGGAARGYKAGGYNLDRAGGPNTAITFLLGGGMPAPITGESLEFEEETVINYEGGFKTTLFGGDATLNLTGFYAEYENYQLNTFNGISFLVENIDEVISSGFEVDFLAQPIEQIFLQGGYTYANTRYGDDITSTIISSNGQPLNGRRITLAPLHSLTGAMTFTEQLLDTNYDIFMNWNFRYSSDYNTGSDLDPEKVQEDYIIANASIGLLAQDNGLELEAFVRNITDADVFQVAFDTPLQAGSFNAFLTEPRTYGVTLRYRF